MTAVTSSELALRRVPKQKRSRETFESILNAASMLIEERGLAGFNTNLLSARSGISVRAIYRYFPNKHALVVEIARRLTLDWQRQIENRQLSERSEQNWPARWCETLDHFMAAVDASPGAIPVLQAMRSDPELRAIDDAKNAVYARSIVRSLMARDPQFGRSRAETVAELLMKTTVAAVDAAIDAKRAHARRLIAGLKEMHRAYLREVLDG